MRGMTGTGKNQVVVWAPMSRPQQALLHCPADEIFFGGARGGGKTDGMLGKFALKQSLYGRDCVGVFFRRTREDLREAIERSHAIYGPLGARYNESKKEWRFQSGARLKFAYLERDADAQNYQGHSYTDLFFEELTNWPDPGPINKLRATLRSAAGVPCQFHATGNPGGPGHAWVKQRYIDPCPSGWRFIYEQRRNPFTGDVVKSSRVFIPSKLSDNPTLMRDPGYVARLQQSGSEQLVRAWLEGDWNIVDGAYFDCWQADRHVLHPFDVPGEWPRFISLDWGSAAPFSVGWWAIVPDWYRCPSGDWLPRGALVRYREWYGCRDNQPNVGLKLTAEDVGRGIAERSAGEPRYLYGVADPAAFAQDGGPSIMERLMAAEKSIRGRLSTSWQRADNRRVGRSGALGGWDQFRARLIGEDYGEPYGKRPMAYVFSTCRGFIRTVPVLQHDPNRPEDIDTNSEDHVADETRYAFMSRPYIPERRQAEPDKIIRVGAPSTVTFDDLWRDAERSGIDRI